MTPHSAFRGRRGQVDDFVDGIIGLFFAAIAIGLLLFGGFGVRQPAKAPELDHTDALPLTAKLLTLARLPVEFEGRTTTLAALMGEYPWEADEARRARLRQQIEAAVLSLYRDGTIILLDYNPSAAYPSGTQPVLTIPDGGASPCRWDFTTQYLAGRGGSRACDTIGLPDAAGQAFHLTADYAEGRI